MNPLILLVGGIAVAVGISSKKKPTQTDPQPDKTADNFKPLDDKKGDVSASPSSPTASKSDSFPLQVGSNGQNVENWQKLLINYFVLTKNSILKTDPMKLDVNGNPDGSFGPQTKRYSIAAVNSSVVKVETYAWLFAQVATLKAAQTVLTKNQSGLVVGDKVYTKGKRTISRYRAKLDIQKNGVWVTPTFQQFLDYLKKGVVTQKFDDVPFENGELMGKVAQISGDKIRVVVTSENNLHNWWANPMAVNKDYFVVSKNDIFK